MLAANAAARRRHTVGTLSNATIAFKTLALFITASTCVLKKDKASY